MNWSSWSEFFAMGGHAPYVWGSYGVTFLLMAVEVFLLRRRRNAVMRRIRRLARMQRETNE